MSHKDGELLSMLSMGMVTALALVAGCAPTAKVTTPAGPGMQEVQQESYAGPKARIAVAGFTDKTGKGWWTREIGDGMADMLATALFHSNRFIVLERQALQDLVREQELVSGGEVRRDAAVTPGQLEGADLLVTGAVTEFEGNVRGAAGAGGGVGGGILGAVLGGMKQAHLAIDLRVIDVRTGRIVNASTVEAKATDVGLGGLLGGLAGGGALAGALAGWAKTPMEKALRVAIHEAVQFVVKNTPAEYFRHGQADPVSSAAPEPSPPEQRAVYVTASSARLRQGPGTDFGEVGVLYRGARVLVLETKDRWHRIRTQDGKEGWIASWLTSRQP